MSDYIRAGVELADGWRIVRASEALYVQSPFTGLCELNELSQGEKDALAAQLVRQVDALDTDLIIKREFTHLGMPERAEQVMGDDRTMNTIKAIVDSGVLA